MGPASPAARRPSLPGWLYFEKFSGAGPSSIETDVKLESHPRFGGESQYTMCLMQNAAPNTGFHLFLLLAARLAVGRSALRGEDGGVKV